MTEAQNGDGDDFGFERLVALAVQLAGATTSIEAGSMDLLATLRQELARFAGGRPLDDDLTLALVRRL
jgi:serine phosphatase RsbU (regulator of sigma subunit)